MPPTIRWLPRILCVLSLLVPAALAQEAIDQDREARNSVPQEQRYLVDIELQTAMEFLDLLTRAEQLLVAGADIADDEAKVSFVLHGPVLRNLLRENYVANKKLVDLAASLSALNVIEVKACRAWMGANGVSEQQLLPFVETVPYGPGAVKAMLKEQNYLRF